MTSELVRVRVGALNFDNISRVELVQKLTSSIGQSESYLLYTPNLQFQRQARINSDISHLLERADLLVCDSRFLQTIGNARQPIKLERLAGSSILEWILEISHTTEISLAIVGGQERSHEMFSERITSDFAGRVRATYTSREFSAIPTTEDVEFCLDFLRTANADFVIYSLGFPKQERLAWEMRKRNVRGFHLSLGAAVDYSAGVRMRSPVFLQKLGLEWAWRFFSEPKRLFRRYILEGIPEAIRLLLGVVRT